MITCTIHEHPNPPAERLDRAERLRFVRDGFRWSAFLFAPFWLLAKRLWLPFLGFVLVTLAIGAAVGWLSLGGQWAVYLSLALQAILGYEAASLERWKLDRLGWRTIGMVSGRNREDCERRFFTAWLADKPMTPEATPRPAASLLSPLRTAFGWRT